MAEQRFLAWEPLFPVASRFEGSGLPAWLAVHLAEQDSHEPARVLISSDAEAGDLPALEGYEGVVALNSSLSPRRLREAGFEYVSTFAALPSIEDPRWLIPLERGGVAAEALNNYTPYRPAARLKLKILRLMLRTGPVLWRPQKVTIARRNPPELLQRLRGLLPNGEIHLAVSTGTAGPGRKSTLAALDGSGAPLAFAKMAETATAERLMQNEALILREIGDANRPQLAGPRLLFEGQLDGHPVTIQSPVAGRPAPRNMCESHFLFLQTLSHGLPRPGIESAFLRSLPERLDAVGLSSGGLPLVLHQAIQILAEINLSPTLLHGDFAPWNLRLESNTITAFDWEYGVLDGLPGLDELHHHWQTGFLLHGWSAKQADGFLWDWASRPPASLGRGHAEALVIIYLLHGLVQRLETGYEDSDEMVGRYFEVLRRRLALQEVPA